MGDLSLREWFLEDCTGKKECLVEGWRSLSFSRVLLFHFWKMLLSLREILGILLTAVLDSSSLVLNGLGLL